MTVPPSRALLEAVLRRDFLSFAQRCFQTVLPGERFVPAWYLEVIADHLEQVHQGRIRRLIVCLPPRHLKSLVASVAFPAWMLGHDPSARIVTASYAIELAAKHARDGRAVMDSAWYRRLFPRTQLDPAKCSEIEVTTTRRGFRYTTSVGGTLTGRGGKLIVVDDPLKAQDAYSEAKRTAAYEWFRGTLLSRLDDKAADAIVIVTQRLHVDDLVGQLLRDDPEGWTVVSLPAIAAHDERHALPGGGIARRSTGEALHPQREDLVTLERLQLQLGSAVFAAQYLQEPLPETGGLVQWSWFKTEPLPPSRQAGDRIVISWDTATKAQEIHDWTVGTVWLARGAEHHLLDLVRVRLDYPALRRRIVEEAKRWNADAVLIEDTGSGSALIQDLRSSGELYPIAVVPEGDKVTRFHAQSLVIEQGRVWLPERAPWLDAFKAEVLAFPYGCHDDQIDSVSQYLAWARDHAPSTFRPEDFYIGPQLAALGDPLSPWFGQDGRWGERFW